MVGKLAQKTKVTTTKKPVRTPVKAAAIAAKGSLLERVGGKDAVAAVVDAFYDKVFADRKLKPFFCQHRQSKAAPTAIQVSHSAYGWQST